MKTLPLALQAHLDSGATTLAWCWRIERSDGVVFGFTDHDRELSFGGVTFAPGHYVYADEDGVVVAGAVPVVSVPVQRQSRKRAMRRSIST